MWDSCSRQGSGQVLRADFSAFFSPLPRPSPFLKVDNPQELAQLKNLIEIKREKRVEA